MVNFRKKPTKLEGFSFSDTPFGQFFIPKLTAGWPQNLTPAFNYGNFLVSILDFGGVRACEGDQYGKSHSHGPFVMN